MRVVILVLLLVADGARAGTPSVLRVCGDRDSGFERDIAAVIARELNMNLEYTWFAHGASRRLKERRCDAIMGVPVGLGPGTARTTAPYYRSGFAFVSRADRGLVVRSLADPRLAKLTVGVPLAEPRVVPVVGTYTQVDDVMRAVVDGQLDVAIVWGPRAGAFASCVTTGLVITPIDEVEAFDVAIGVRRSDRALAARLDRALAARHDEIVRILDAWQVPRATP